MPISRRFKIYLTKEFCSKNLSNLNKTGSKIFGLFKISHIYRLGEKTTKLYLSKSFLMTHIMKLMDLLLLETKKRIWKETNPPIIHEIFLH